MPHECPDSVHNFYILYTRKILLHSTCIRAIVSDVSCSRDELFYISTRYSLKLKGVVYTLLYIVLLHLVPCRGERSSRAIGENRRRIYEHAIPLTGNCWTRLRAAIQFFLPRIDYNNTTNNNNIVMYTETTTNG